MPLHSSSLLCMLAFSCGAYIFLPLSCFSHALPLGSAPQFFMWKKISHSWITFARYKESFPFLCNSHLVTFYVWTLSLHFHQERFSISQALEENPCGISDPVNEFWRMWRQAKSPFSLLGVSSQLARFQFARCVVFFCDVAGNTGTVRLLVRDEAAVMCGEERITKGVGKISKGAQTCNYEKSSGLAFLWSLFSLFSSSSCFNSILPGWGT